MTDHIVDANKKVSPCPVCGTVPIHINDHEAYYYAKCQCEYPKHVTKTPVDCWPQICWIKLGKYVAEVLDIHTIAQLNARMAPDPRVAVLEKKLAKLTDKLAMVEQESEQRLSAIIGYSDQLLAMKEKVELCRSLIAAHDYAKSIGAIE